MWMKLIFFSILRFSTHLRYCMMGTIYVSKQWNCKKKNHPKIKVPNFILCTRCFAIWDLVSKTVLMTLSLSDRRYWWEKRTEGQKMRLRCISSFISCGLVKQRYRFLTLGMKAMRILRKLSRTIMEMTRLIIKVPVFFCMWMNIYAQTHPAQTAWKSTLSHSSLPLPRIISLMILLLTWCRVCLCFLLAKPLGQAV